jgi:Domain of unknown function (DUF4145)
MTPVAGSASVKRGVIRDRVQGCFRCDGCGSLNIALATGMPGDREPLQWLAARKNPDWKPQPPPRPVAVKTFPDVPPKIAAAASEAYKCRAVSHSYRAAVLVARSVIEATAKDKGIRRGGLADKIDKLYEMQLIRPHVRDGAHEVRYLGNEMAHGDFVQPISPEDTDLVLTLMVEVLADVYQSPARVARAQAKRQERKALEARVAAALAEGRALPASGTSVTQVAAIQAFLLQSTAQSVIIESDDSNAPPPVQQA